MLFVNVVFAQIVVPAGGYVTESFDAANTWVFGGNASSWTWANPNKAEITDDISGGGKCLILGGNGVSTWVNPNENSWAESPYYNLSAVSNPYIEFWFYHSNEASTNYDEIWMEYSLNGGSNWLILSAPLGTNNCYDQNWYNFTDNWGGASNAAACCTNSGACSYGGGIGPTGWMLVRKCVAGSLANQPNVIFRFRSDNGTICNYYGATIDDFSVHDAVMVADFDYNCLGINQIQFIDASEKCPNQWHWNFGDGISSNLQNPIHTYSAPGTYTVSLVATATTAITAGCGGPLTDSISYTVTVLSGTASTLSNVSCQGGADGMATANITGGTPPFTYSWSTGANTQNASGLAAGIYTVTLSASAACPITSSVTITEPTAITVTDTSIATSCGSAIGSIDLTANGGQGPYSYSWSTGANTEDVSGLATGSYTVTLTDANGCIALYSTNVATVGTTISVASTVTDASCNTDNGIINLMPTSGSAPYTYIWNTGETTEDISALLAQTYSVTTTDAGGCNNVLNLTVGLIGPSELITDTIVNLTCSGVNSGEINITMTGAAPFNYLWNNGTTTDDNSGLAGGVYTVTVIDANSCAIAQSFTVTEPSAIVITTDAVNDVHCGSPGSISLSTSGGTAGYTFLWNNGAVTEDISGLNAGIYSLTVTDANGCQMQGSNYTINDAGLPVISNNTVTNTSCFAGTDGSINLVVSGGTAAYTYAWSNGQNTSAVNGLGAGVFVVTVTDNQACTVSQAFTVTEPAQMMVNVVITNASCVNNDAMAAAIVSGGTGIYSFQWSNGQSNQNLSNLPGPANISLTVTDANACTVGSVAYSIGIDTSLSVSGSINNLDCSGANIGSIVLTPSDGALPYSYLWANGATTNTLNALSVGVYTVTVTDASGCSFTDSYSVTIPLIPLLSAFIEQTGILDSTIFLSESLLISAGNDQSGQGVSYQWVANPSDAVFGDANSPVTTIQPGTIGDYTLMLIATSPDGCRDTSQLSITVEEVLDPQYPTAFTPNNDGENDLFRFIDLDNKNILEFTIYNRWGQVVFNNADKSGAWDGTFNGADQPVDIYVYVLIFERRTDINPIVIRGAVTLLR